nr:hypothetical protein [Streptomyces sp. 891-h]
MISLEACLHAGEFPSICRPPFILGCDISGVVEESPETWRFRPGDDWFGVQLFPRPAYAYAYANAELVAAHRCTWYASRPRSPTLKPLHSRSSG